MSGHVRNSAGAEKNKESRRLTWKVFLLGATSQRFVSSCLLLLSKDVYNCHPMPVTRYNALVSY